jgi:hypothetical protein
MNEGEIFIVFEPGHFLVALIQADTKGQRLINLPKDTRPAKAEL